MESKILEGIGVDPGIFIIGMLVAIVILFFLVVSMSLKYSRLKTSYNSFMRGKDAKTMEWYAESGIIGLETPDQKYLSRISIRLQLDAGAEATVKVQYDSIDEFQTIGRATASDRVRTTNIPIIPRRCDHLRLRLEGTGGCKIFSITKTFEESEDT